MPLKHTDVGGICPQLLRKPTCTPADRMGTVTFVKLMEFTAAVAAEAVLLVTFAPTTRADLRHLLGRGIHIQVLSVRCVISTSSFSPAAVGKKCTGERLHASHYVHARQILFSIQRIKTSLLPDSN
jgi:hypothetical protein